MVIAERKAGQPVVDSEPGASSTTSTRGHLGAPTEPPSTALTRP